MPNPNDPAFIKGFKENVGPAVAQLVYKESSLSNFFVKKNGTQVIGSEGDAVQWQTNPIATAKEYEFRVRTKDVEEDRLARTSVIIKLDTHLTSLITLTAEQLTLDLKNYGTEVLRPQIDALVRESEIKFREKLRGITWQVATLAADEADSPYEFFSEVGHQLNAVHCPRGNRTIICGARVHSWITTDQVNFQNTPKSTSENAYRENIAGRIAGLTVLPDETLGDYEFYVVTPGAMVSLSLRPDLSQFGNTLTSAGSAQGWNFGVMRFATERRVSSSSLLTSFLGVNSVEDAIQWDEDGRPVFVNGELVKLPNNARGAKGVLTPTP